jgi:hypothetical protein
VGTHWGGGQLLWKCIRCFGGAVPMQHKEGNAQRDRRLLNSADNARQCGFGQTLPAPRRPVLLRL